MLNVLVLLLFLTVFNGVTVERLCAKSGELVALQCPQSRLGQKAKVTWSTPQISDIGSVNQTGLLIIDGRLVILRASDDLQENYSCSNGVIKKTFDLRVYSTLISDCENVTRYKTQCYAGQACALHCPTSYTPENIPDLTSKGVTWQGDKALCKESYDFSSVKESDQGVYTCVRSFLFHGQVYNMTFTLVLDVDPEENIKHEGIISPHSDEVFSADVGSSLVINCTAWIFSDFNEVYWKSGENSIKTDNSLRVYSSTNEDMGEGQKTTASLIFKEVSKEDLSTVFTCTLESMSQKSSNVSVTLKQKERPSYAAVTVTAVVIPVVTVICVLIYIKYKVHITLFLRDTLGCHSKVSDGKSFDAFIMYYESEQGPGLSGDDRRTLQSVLEDQFGYSLCLFNRNVLPGKAVADAVLECVEQSRAVLLVPASPNLSSESALLSAVHEALVERQTRLVFIKSISTKKTRAEPLSETLQLLTDLGHCVTWRGSLAQSSYFWKQLRYYLPPVQEPHKMSLLPHIVVVEDKQ